MYVYCKCNQALFDSQSDSAGRFIGSYGELEGEHHSHTDGHRDDQLDDLLSSMAKGSLQ